MHRAMQRFAEIENSWPKCVCTYEPILLLSSRKTWTRMNQACWLFCAVTMPSTNQDVNESFSDFSVHKLHVEKVIQTGETAKVILHDNQDNHLFTLQVLEPIMIELLEANKQVVSEHDVHQQCASRFMWKNHSTESAKKLRCETHSSSFMLKRRRKWWSGCPLVEISVVSNNKFL
jgi:hypothetical protein